MGKQDRAVKKSKKGKAKAEEIISEAVANVATKTTATKWDSERIEGCSDEDFLLGVRCRELREEGEAWWAIAKALELPGAGDSATTGKKGASRARTVYKAAFGSFPRTFKTGVVKSIADRNEHVREMQKKKKSDLKAVAMAGKSVISEDMSDEDVAGMLKGRKIRWYSNELMPEGVDRECAISPTAPLYIMGEGKDRVIEFREQHRRAPADVRWMPAQIRTVRLRQIYSVK